MIRKGFTLLELLVVIAIMGLLGVAAAASYSQVVRGMTERGAVAAVSGILRAANERAHVDRQPTAVYCYNRLLKAPNDGDDIGIVVGEVVAVRRTGRLTRVSGRFLYDEFADLDINYDTDDDRSALQRGGTFRLYRFAGERPEFKYSLVADRVFVDEESEMMTFFSGMVTNFLSTAFYDTQKSDYQPTWKTGDGYGFQFMELQLPHGIVFEQQIPSGVGRISTPKVYYFDPMRDATDTIDIWSTKPDASGYPKLFKKCGTATADASTGV